MLSLPCAPLLFSLILLSSCSGNGPAGGEQLTPAIYGRVLDAAGQPVADAAVGLRFSITRSDDTSGKGSRLAIYPNPVINSAEALTQVPEPGPVSIKLLRWGSREVLSTPREGIFSAGNHISLLNMSDYPNGMYIVRCEQQNDTGERYMLLNDPESWRSVVRTDGDGRFVIPYSLLPISVPFLFTFENGMAAGWRMIGDSLGISIAGEAGKTVVWNLKIDTTAVVDSTLRL